MHLQDMDPGVVKAFQDLTYEDETPLSLGEHFKQLGNDRFKRGRKNSMYFRHAQQVRLRIPVWTLGTSLLVRRCFGIFSCSDLLHQHRLWCRRSFSVDS